MADIERTLLTKTISSGELIDVIARGIETDHFADPECRDVYDYALWFLRKYKNPPTIKAIKSEFPEFKTKLSKEPLNYHLDKFIIKVKERKAIDLVRDYHDILDDPDEIENIELHAMEMARQLIEVVPESKAAEYADPKRIDEYLKKKKDGTPLGLYLGIPTFDEPEIMGGVQPHEILVIVGYMGMGKSILLAHIALSIYLQKKKVLFISLEMEADAILRRIDTMVDKVKYQARKALELKHGDVENWKRILEQAEENKHEANIHIIDDIRNCTSDKVLAETMRYSPDAVVCDYLELMSTPKGSGAHWEKVAYSAEQLKQNSRILKIPTITAAQLNREGGRGEVTLANVSHQAIGKHSDLLIGLSQTEEEEVKQVMRAIILKNRDGPKRIAELNWVLSNMDVGEKGVAERFPERRGAKSLIGHTRRKERRMEIARNVAGKDNPFKVAA